MIVFFIFPAVEILFCLFRSTQKNTVRLICNAVSVLIACAAGFIAVSAGHSFIDLFDIDFSFGGMLDARMAQKLCGIAGDFGSGVLAVGVFVVVYLVLKLISQIVVFFVFRKNEKAAFHPLGIVFGIVIGIIFAGVVLTPVTGILQLFPDAQAKAEVKTGILEKNLDGKALKYSEMVLDSNIDRMTRYTGMGLITDKLFNIWTTARTDTGSENLKTLAGPYFGRLDRIPVLTADDTALEDKAYAAADVLDTAAVTSLFSDKEKLGIIEKIVNDNQTSLEELPEYGSISSLAGDLRLAGEVAGILERSGFHLTGNINIAKIDISSDDMMTVIDRLYSMDQAEFYISYILSAIFETDRWELVENADIMGNRDTVKLICSDVMKLKRLNDRGQLTTKALMDVYNELKGNGIISDAKIEELVLQYR